MFHNKKNPCLISYIQSDWYGLVLTPKQSNIFYVSKQEYFKIVKS